MLLWSTYGQTLSTVPGSGKTPARGAAPDNQRDEPGPLFNLIRTATDFAQPEGPIAPLIAVISKSAKKDDAY